MPDIDRNNFYSDGSDDGDDDGTEYEVEPPDPTVLAEEARRADEIIAASQLAVDLHEIYDEAEGHADREFFDELVHGIRLRFTTQHLLLAMTVVAVVIAVARQAGFGTVFLLAALLVIGGITAFLSWKQHEREVKLEQRRQELFARRRTAQRLAQAQKAALLPADELPEEEPDATESDSPPAERPTFRLQFSLAEMMAASICVAVLCGLVAVLGLSITATLIGFIALGGLVLHAMGLEPPYAVAFGWWALLLLYILLSIVAAVWHSIG